MDYLMMFAAVVGFLLILSLLIFVHELGHFVVAKRSGITVEEFAIGFPPRAIKVWQDEGQITLDGKDFIIGRKVAVPRDIKKGSQVYAETTIDEEGRPVITTLELVVETEDEKETNLTPTLSSASERPTVPVDAITKPTEYALNWLPFGGYVRMVGEEDPTDPGSFAGKSKRVRVAVLVAGSFMNLIAAVVFFTLSSLSGVPEPVLGINSVGQEAVVAKTVISQVVPDTPAEKAGLLAKDIIVGAGDGVEFNYTGDLIAYVKEMKGKEIILHIERNGENLDTSLTPRANPPKGQGSMGVGISYDFDNKITYYSPSTALIRGVSQTAEYVSLVFYVPTVLIKEANLEPDQKTIPVGAARPTGPVGIFQQIVSTINAAISLNWWYPVFWMTAILSSALAITNMLPLPALDGGRIFFIAIEAVRGKRISPEKEGAIHLVGLAMLLTLMLVVSYYDISNPIPPIDWASLF